MKEMGLQKDRMMISLSILSFLNCDIVVDIDVFFLAQDTLPPLFGSLLESWHIGHVSKSPVPLFLVAIVFI